MIKLRAFDAGAGDSLLISSDSAAVLIDGGESGAFDDHIAPELATGPQLDLVVVTHWDGDHILGIRNLYQQQELAEVRAPAVRFNHFMSPDLGTPAPSGLDVTISSVEDGSELVSLLRNREVDVSGASAGESIAFDDLVLSVLGPSQELLDEAESEWNEHIAALGQADVGLMAAIAAVEPDDSPTNRASITTLVSEPGGPPLALLTGDTTSADLIDQLVSAGIIGTWGCLHVPVLKVQHHASERNVTTDFMERVTADHYIISANGRHKNPDPSVLTLIIDAAVNEDAAIWFTSEGNTANQRERIEQARLRVEDASVRIGNAPNTPVEIVLTPG